MSSPGDALAVRERDGALLLKVAARPGASRSMKT